MSKRTAKNPQTVNVFDESVEAALSLQSRRNKFPSRTRQEEYELLDRMRHMYRNRKKSRETNGAVDPTEDGVESVPQEPCPTRGKKRRREDEESTNDHGSIIESSIGNLVTDPDGLPRRNFKRLKVTSENGNNIQTRDLDIEMEIATDHGEILMTEDEDALSDWERELHEEAHLELYEREKDQRYLRRALPDDVVYLLDDETGTKGTARTRFRTTKFLADPFEIQGNHCCVRGCSFRTSQIQDDDDDETSDSDWWSVLRIKRNKRGMPAAQRRHVTDSFRHGSKKETTNVDDLLLDDWTSDSSSSASSGYSSSPSAIESTSWTPTGWISPANPSSPESVWYAGYHSPRDSDVADGEEESDRSDEWVDDSEEEVLSEGIKQPLPVDEYSSDGGMDDWNYGGDVDEEGGYRSD